MSSIDPPDDASVLARARRRLAGTPGAQWLDLSHAAEGFETEPFHKAESAADAAFSLDLSRRQFLALVAAGAGMSALSACRKPIEKILPYQDSPEHVVPGRPLFFATALEWRGYARGALVESHTGRPTKIEGNPDHPDSLGATDSFMQAAILGLYDADRSQAVKLEGEISTWQRFWNDYRQSLSGELARQGAGIRILTRTVTSPTLASQIDRFLGRFPKARWHQYEPVNGDNRFEGSRLAFGRILETRYRLDDADVILALDADFLASMPGGLRYAREFGRRRKPENGPLNRMYAVEPTPSKTGAVADHRLRLSAADVPDFAGWLARACGARIEGNPRLPAGVPLRWAKAVASDLRARRGRSVVIPGLWQPPIVHALTHAINRSLGSEGRTIDYSEPIPARPANQLDSVRELCEAMKSGAVELLLILDGNPVYDAPADFGFSDGLKRVPNAIHLSLYDDETSASCRWRLPAAHALEKWGDSRAFDGTASIVQPLISPLYEGKTALELLAGSLEITPPSDHDIVREYWRSKERSLDFDMFWRESLRKGVIERTSSPILRAPAVRSLSTPMPASTDKIEVLFRPDPSVDDGTFSNNAWLQELPKPLTRLTWDNAALISPILAEKMGMGEGDVVSISLSDRVIRAPVWILPGQAERTITLPLGYGRTRGGRWAAGSGFDAYPLRGSGTFWNGPGASAAKTGQRRAFSRAQAEQRMAGRDPAKAMTLLQYRNGASADFSKQEPPADDTLYPLETKGEHAWGMAIDLGSCIGCNACVAACQVENNIPTVGRVEVGRGRIMQWIRVDGYFQGDVDDPQMRFQPVPCMHCADAPCELVCPVGATVHDDEGLNEMIYNRCVGTRYCSNNCPYKVRRFNFFWYSDGDDPARRLGYNPDVTVRARGVMEKCTYCVQRIKEGEIRSDVEGRPMRDGDVVTACQAACPAEAIVFGDLKDPKSKVVEVKARARDYSLLAELGTRPRTTYSARITNPNPELE